MPDFAPYTRTEALRAEDLDVHIVVHEQQFSRLLVPVVNAGYFKGLVNTMRGLPLHVGAHPLSNSMDSAIRWQVRRDRGQRMLVSTLAARLRNAFESDPQTKGVMKGERDDLPRGIQGFWEDVIIRVLRGLIREQHEP
jgi:hypothetical protein